MDRYVEIWIDMVILLSWIFTLYIILSNGGQFRMSSFPLLLNDFDCSPMMYNDVRLLFVVSDGQSGCL